MAKRWPSSCSFHEVGRHILHVMNLNRNNLCLFAERTSSTNVTQRQNAGMRDAGSSTNVASILWWEEACQKGKIIIINLKNILESFPRL